MIDYIEVFLYFTASIFGIMLIIQMLSVYIKFKNAYLGLFLLSFVATSFLAFFYLINDLGSLSVISEHYIFTAYGETISMAVIMWSLTMVILRAVYDDIKVFVRVVVYALAVLPCAANCLWLAGVVQLADLDSYYYIFFLCVLVVDCILFLRKYKKINLRSFKKLAIVFASILSLFVLFLIIQEIVPKFTLDIFPIFYLLWTLQLITFSWKHFFKEGINIVFNIEDSFFEKYNITKREQEIILLIQEGYTNSAISKKLFLSEKTVANHIYNIFKKLNINSRFELICLFKK